MTGSGLNLRPSVMIPDQLDLPEIESVTLGNGLELLGLEDHTLPIITLVVVAKVGYCHESQSNRGLLDLVAATLPRGSRRLGADEIADRIEQVGASLIAVAGQESLRIVLQMLSKDLGPCLDILCELLLEPRYAADELALAQKLTIEGLQATRNDARKLADTRFETAFWTDCHHRGWPVTAETVSSVTRDDLVAVHDRFICPNNTIITMAGDFRADRLQRDLADRLAGWPAHLVPELPSPILPAHRQLRWLLVDKPDQTQAHIELGGLGFASCDPLFPAANLVDYVAGGGFFSSRLLQALRAEAGLCYHVDSCLDELREAGAFKVSAITRTDRTSVAIDRILSELERLRCDGVSDQELADARTHLWGAALHDLQSASDILHIFVNTRLQGHGDHGLHELPERIASITHDQVHQAAQHMLDRSRMAGVIVGRADDIGPLLEAGGHQYGEYRSRAAEASRGG